MFVDLITLIFFTIEVKINEKILKSNFRRVTINQFCTELFYLAIISHFFDQKTIKKKNLLSNKIRDKTKHNICYNYLLR